MRVAVTGASGFIGEACLRAVKAAGHEVVCVAASDTSAARLASLGWRSVIGRIESAESWLSKVGPLDAVINSAYGGLQDLSDGPSKLLAAMEKAKIPRLLHMGSAAVYGFDMPSAPNPEKAPLAGQSPYRKAKIASDEALIAHRGSTQVTVLRPHLVYGPQSGRVRRLGQAIILGRVFLPEEALQPTNFVYVDNLAWRAVRLLDPGMPKGIYCVRDAPLSWADLADALASALGQSLSREATSTREEWLQRESKASPSLSLRAPLEADGVQTWLKSLSIVQENAPTLLKFAGPLGIRRARARRHLAGQVSILRHGFDHHARADLGMHLEMSGRGLLNTSLLDGLLGAPPVSTEQALRETAAWTRWIFSPPVLSAPCFTSHTS